MFAEDRRDYTLAHDLLRRCLSAYRPVEPGAWDFQADAAGKPYLRSDPTLSFNLSHTRQLVACAIAAGAPVGIDVERAARLVDAGAIAGRYFSTFEVASLARCRDDAHRLRFLELWTLKESFVKAVGVGLTMPLDSMSFALDDEHAVSVPASCRIHRVGMALRPVRARGVRSNGRRHPGPDASTLRRTRIRRRPDRRTSFPVPADVFANSAPVVKRRRLDPQRSQIHVSLPAVMDLVVDPVEE